MPKNQIIYTNEAKCQDCYRCVRVCPVKAITMKHGQAQVDSEKCIVCGTCIRECPQNAKTYRRDIEQVKKLLGEYQNVAIAVAPSFYSIYDDWQRKRIPSLLRKIGFSQVYEVAESAFAVAEKTCEYAANHPNSNCITTSCPVFVSYIEKYHPAFINNLVPVVSPLVAFARKLKNMNHDDIKLAFLGPCIGKKYEIMRSEFAGLVDVVLTFQEFNEWLKEEQIDMKSLEESSFDRIDLNKADLFPLVGGLIKTASGKHIIPEDKVLAVSGVEDIDESLKSLDERNNISFVEPLFCKNGCINGPGIISDKSVFQRKYELNVLNTNKSVSGINYDKDLYLIEDLSTKYAYDKSIKRVNYTDEEIRNVLEKTGKADKEDQLDCGACGYISCREKAIAVLSGMAEIEMCMPYAIRQARQRTDRIIESSPNGIVIVDDQLCIIHMNPAFRRFFMCTNSILGKRISYLMDPELFVKVKEGEEEKIEQIIKHENYNLICHQILYKLEPENQFVGIFVNITKNITDSTKLDELRQQTILQAQELLNHQIDMAQKIARYIGESAAKGEELVENLMKLADDEKEQKVTKHISSRDKSWIWNTYTSK